MKDRIEKYTGKAIKDSSTEDLYEAILQITKNEMDKIPTTQGDRRLYYMSAEFLIGKLLSNNLMNLGLYDEVKETLEANGKDLALVEEYEAEPSLGNGGLGRLAACFLDSIATLGLAGEGLGLLYHYGLFRQVFRQNRQEEERDVWLDKPSWLRKTDFVTDVHLQDMKLQSRMYEIDIMGYQNEKTSLRLFDLESINDEVIESGIDFDQSAWDQNLTLFLYPDDSTEEGLRLRFVQQYFMVASNLAWILHQHEDELDELHKHVVIQINDTHPAMSIALLIKELIHRDIAFEEAVEIVSNTFAYTNHTILAEALETWPLAYFEAVDPELVDILVKLQAIVEERSDKETVALIDENKRVHMAALSIHFTYSVNGVAALHTEILKNSELKDYYELYPEKFNNKTNGITFRRWLLFSNPELSAYLEAKIGDEFKKDATALESFLSYQDDEDVLKRILEIKDLKKEQLADYIQASEGIKVLDDAIYDIQIKRLHEYKRQQLNLLYIIHQYLAIKDGYRPKRATVFFFGSKAAPAYTIAKDIIHALLTMQEIIAKDPLVSQYMQIIFVENYNVSKAEMLIPACDISEQISLASKEASGTGNMKLMLNGALTLGTMDGANVEIAELVGEENIYIFGEDSDTIIDHYENETYVSKDYYEQNPAIRRAVDFLVSDIMLEYGHEEELSRLHHELISKDWFMTLIDFDDYVETKNKMIEDYEDRMSWAKKMLINIAKAGFFSSDRTIAEYNRDIWRLK